MPTMDDLEYLQSMPLEIKLGMTRNRIREWVREFGTNGVYVSFSGGKDSTVLLHIVREMYPDIEAAFVDTGLEYPEIRRFVKTFDNVTILRPKMRFDEVIRRYGYPMISKEVSHCVSGGRSAMEQKNGTRTNDALKKMRGEAIGKDGKKSRYNHEKYEPLLHMDFFISDTCCEIMKKRPAKKFERESNKTPFIATLADESALRKSGWLKYGCNAFDAKRQKSTPISFWTEQDVLQYIKQNGTPIASVYGDIVVSDKDGNDYDQTIFGDTGKLHTTGCNRTGCIFCGFGCHLEKEPSRFQRLKVTHPRKYEYCLGGGEYDEDGIWKPNKDGLGMRHVFDELNRIYGDGFIKY